jgi:predicted DCC family thiol-disulfide oxidoreductase YuxK
VDGETLVFYDGLCGLCDKLVQFLLPRDRGGALRFAELQGEVARRELMAHGYDPTDLDTVYVIANWTTPRQRVLTRSRAILHAIESLGGFWSPAARLARLIPAPLADRVYDFVARRRYRVFGKFDACPLPRPEWRDRFVR